MLDPRMTKLAELLVNYSCGARPGDKILIEAIDIPHAFTNELIRVTSQAGAIPLLKLDSNVVRRTMLRYGTDEGWKAIADCERTVMEKVQCYIGVRGNHNVSELSDVSGAQQALYEKTVWHTVHQEIRVKKTRWVVLRWPTPSMAQLAEMSTEAFENFFFDVCTLDYRKMEQAMKPLIKRMERTDKVRIKGPGDTDLTFSIKDIPIVGCSGHRNIPDGEVFTAPVKDSVNGIIQFNTPTIYRGETHFDIRLEFRDGKVIKASSSNSEKLNEVLDTDPGARYVGEFAIGFNPYCVRPMKDILFDEKMAGSIHFTPGQCYEETENGNRSAVHWDMVLRQTQAQGGGELYFDGELVRRDGLFLSDELQGLNPTQLVK